MNDYTGIPILDIELFILYHIGLDDAAKEIKTGVDTLSSKFPDLLSPLELLLYPLQMMTSPNNPDKYKKLKNE
jgi:hypothetical protein